MVGCKECQRWILDWIFLKEATALCNRCEPRHWRMQICVQRRNGETILCERETWTTQRAPFALGHTGTVYVSKVKGLCRALKRTQSFKFHCRWPRMTGELNSLLSLLPVEASLVGGGLRRIAHGAIYVFMCGIPVEWNWIPFHASNDSNFFSFSTPCLLGLLSLSESYPLLLSVTGCAHTSYSARVSSFIFIYERLS